MKSRLVSLVSLFGLIVVMLAGATVVRAEPPGNSDFERTWQRTDLPVAGGQATRTWMWGPEAFTGLLQEAYKESPVGLRTVQYFDKSRMEITQPDADASSIWYVTNGLLVVEMVTGRNQLGDNTFVQLAPATANVAGDAADVSGPTYSTFAQYLTTPARPPGFIDEAIDRGGNITKATKWSDYGIGIGMTDEVTSHSIARPFWDFMNSTGTVYENGSYVNSNLFQDPFFATGRPITEAYWATVLVGGQPTDVLIQCFERRCLTYTPSNAPEWQVESGNVGRHYYDWLYQSEDTVDGPCPDSSVGSYIYVADQLNDRIQKFDSSFNFICEWGGGEPPVGFLRPIAVDVGADGYVYVLAETGIHKFNYRGGFEGYTALPDNSGLDFAVNSQGLFVIPSIFNSTIQVYDSGGNLVDEWGSPGSGSGQFDHPWGIAVDSNDWVYVVDQNNDRVQVLKSDGTLFRAFGTSGDADSNAAFSNPIGIDVDSDGGIYVVDSGYVKMFGRQDSGFLATGIWGGTVGNGYAGDTAIVVDKIGKPIAYVVDNLLTQIHRYGFTFGSDGATDLGTSGELGSEPGNFDHPVGIALGTR